MTTGKLELHNILNYCIAQNSGGEKLWQISDFKVLARKTWANARNLYHWREKNFCGSEDELFFVNSLKQLVFIDAP